MLHNGDCIDEVWLYGALDGLEGSFGGVRYHLFNSDPDDVLNNCHHKEVYTRQGSWRIAYCAESELAKSILSNSELYS